MKKRLGKDAETYAAEGIPPEFVTMSRGGRGQGDGGIGSKWLEKYQSDVFPRDYTTVRGVKVKPPKFYFTKYSLSHPLEAEDIKNARIEEGYKHLKDSTPERLKVRERVKRRQIENLKRNLQ